MSNYRIEKHYNREGNDCYLYDTVALERVNGDIQITRTHKYTGWSGKAVESYSHLLEGFTADEIKNQVDDWLKTWLFEDNIDISLVEISEYLDIPCIECPKVEAYEPESDAFYVDEYPEYFDENGNRILED